MSKVTINNTKSGIYNVRTVTWTIPNFLDFLLYQDVKQIRAVNITDAKHQLRLQVLGHNKDIIELGYMPDTNIFTNGELFSSYSSIGQDTSMGKFDFKLVEAGKWQYLATLYKRDINVSDANNRYTYWSPGGSLTFKFIFKILNYERVSHEFINKNQLNYQINAVLSTKQFADVIVKSADGNAHKVHKVIISARSKVFKACLEHDNIESKMNVIESQFKSDILEDVFTFIYSDRVPTINITPEKVLELLRAADYYHLKGLRNLCDEVLCKQLTANNAKEMLELSNTFSAASLKEAATEFIEQIYFYEVVDPDWIVQYFKFYSK